MLCASVRSGNSVASRQTGRGAGEAGPPLSRPLTAPPPICPALRAKSACCATACGRQRAPQARCRCAVEGACSAAGRQRPGQLCGVLRPRLAVLPGAAAVAASRAPGRGARRRAARGGRSKRAPWPQQAARSGRAEPRPSARHGRLPRARRRPGLGPDGAAGRQPRGPEQRLGVGLRLVQRLRARRGSRAGQGAAAAQQAALPRATALRAQVSATVAGRAPRFRQDIAPERSSATGGTGPLSADTEWWSLRGSGGTGCLGVGTAWGSSPSTWVQRTWSSGRWHRGRGSFPGTGSVVRFTTSTAGRVSSQPPSRETQSSRLLGTSRRDPHDWSPLLLDSERTGTSLLVPVRWEGGGSRCAFGCRGTHLPTTAGWQLLNGATMILSCTWLSPKHWSLI